MNIAILLIKRFLLFYYVSSPTWFKIVFTELLTDEQMTGSNLCLFLLSFRSCQQATTDMGRKLGGGCAPFLEKGAGTPSNTMWPEPRPNHHTKWHPNPSNRLATIHQRHRQTDKQTDRTDRQRSDSIGRTVLQKGRPKIKTSREVHFSFLTF